MIRVVVADDHALVRQGLRRVLSYVEDIQLVAEARDAWETIEKLRTYRIDVLVLDLAMPGVRGPDLITRVRAEAPGMPILVLSVHSESEVVARAINAGATGYLTKGAGLELLVEGIRTVCKGYGFIEPRLAAQ